MNTLVITTATEEFDVLSEKCRKSANKFHRFATYRLVKPGTHPRTIYTTDRYYMLSPGELDTISGTRIPTGRFKPKCLESALLDLSMEPMEEEWMVALVDADTIINQSLDEILKFEGDAFVTLRPEEEVGRTALPDITGYINSGVVIARASDEGLSFVKHWDWLTQIHGDQRAINEMINAKAWFEEGYKLNDSGIPIPVNGPFGEFVVRVMPGRIWNWSGFPEKPGPDVRVIHYKGQWRSLISNEI